MGRTIPTFRIALEIEGGEEEGETVEEEAVGGTEVAE
jgi:hypothetical protein